MMKFNSYGDALRHIRTKNGKTYRDITNFVIGAKERDVRDWEDGLAYPNGYQLKGLGILMPQLRHFIHLIPREKRGVETEVDLAMSQASGLRVRMDEAMKKPGVLRDITRAAWEAPTPPPGEKPPTETELAIPAPKTFGESLRHERLLAGLTQEELGELTKVTQGTVARWEAAAHKPVDVSWESIRAVLPNVVEPQDRKSWPKPVGNKSTPDAPDAQPAPVEKWRASVQQIVGDASSRGFLAESLAQAVQDALAATGMSARQLLAAVNEAMGLAKQVRGVLPVHVVEHDRSAPGAREEPAAPAAPPPAPPPAPAWPPPAPAFDVPDLPGLAGAGVRYAVALAKLQHEESVKREVERRLEEAQLAVEIAKEDVQAANDALLKETQAGGAA